MKPAAHMYPSDLNTFQGAETFATAYSVAVGNPDERSVPLYTLSEVAEMKQMLAWAYNKLDCASSSNQDDAQMLDRMRLLLEFGA
jgi:hypothetical protein